MTSSCFFRDLFALSNPAYQLNFHTKELAGEVVESARKESKSTGHGIGKNSLAREVFIWAWQIYKQAGSLAELKRLAIGDFTSGTSNVEPTSYADSVHSPVIIEQRQKAVTEGRELIHGPRARQKSRRSKKA